MQLTHGLRMVLWWLCVCAADPWAHAGSVVAVVCVCVGVRLTHGPTLVLWWLLCVCVQLTHGPTGSVVVNVRVCVYAADPWAHGFCGGCCL